VWVNTCDKQHIDIDVFATDGTHKVSDHRSRADNEWSLAVGAWIAGRCFCRQVASAITRDEDEADREARNEACTKNRGALRNVLRKGDCPARDRSTELSGTHGRGERDAHGL
jgi:hypothetical protein